MAEVYKENLRRLAAALFESEDEDAFDAWEEATHPWKILFLLDENAAQGARIAELERECEKLREDHDKEWRRSETNAQNCIALAAELEACRKDAGYWRYIRDRLGEPNDHDVHAAFHAWCWAEGPLEDVEAAIDAAMHEGGV